MAAGCPSAHAVSAFATIALIIAQVMLVLCWVSPAGHMMKEQWKGLNVSGEAHTIEQTPFWGPVKVIIPEECELVQTWTSLVHEVLREDNVAEPEFCHSHSWSGLNLTLEGLDEDENHRLLTETRRLLSELPDIGMQDFDVAVAHAGAWRRLDADKSAVRDADAIFLPPTKPVNAALQEADHLQSAKAAAALALAKMRNHSHALIRNMFKAERKARTFQVMQCGKNVTFSRPAFSVRYFSMIMLQHQMSTRDKPTFAQTVERRKQVFDMLVVGIWLSMSLKYIPKLCSLAVYFFGDGLSLGRGARTRFDRGIESILLHGISSVFLFTLQISLCTVFLVFWRGGHFVMAHIPCAAYVIFFCSMVVIEVGNELDKVFGWTSRLCTAKLTVMFWSCWAVWMLLITVPLIGTAVFSIQYLSIVRRCGWVNAETVIFSPEFEQAAQATTDACWLFVVLAVIEQVTHFTLDMSEVVRTVPQVPVNAFPHRSKHYHMLELGGK